MSRYGSNKNAKNKYFRLTGLWQSKKNDKLFTGKLRGLDVEKLIAKLEEADGEDIAFFLWENDQESRKDPIFTLQCTVSEGDGFKKRRSRDEDEDEDDRPRRKSRRDEDEEEEEQEEESEEQDLEEDEEDEPKKTKRAAKGSSKTRLKGRTKKSKASKDEDW